MAADHSLINGTNTITNTTTNQILTASSIDTSAANNAQHTLLKTSASGGPPVSSAIASATTQNRTNPTEKGRSYTVRVPATGVRRRETIDPVPGGGPMRKVDNHDKTKTTSQEPYVFYLLL